MLVTGCSSGLGRETALLLARRGYRVFATMRRAAERGGELKAASDGSPGELVVAELDVTDADAARRVVDEAAARGDLEAVVNNAGITVAGFFEDLSDEDLRRVLETNFFGLCNVTRAAIPHLARRGRGTIVQLSSGAGRFTLPMLCAYAASKHAVEGLSEGLRHELAPLGIRVVLLEPGNYRTPMQLGDQEIRGMRGAHGLAVRRLTEQTRRTVRRLGGDPEQAARVIVRAVESGPERLRRPVGLDAWGFIAAKRFLPFALWEVTVASVLRAAGYGARRRRRATGAEHGARSEDWVRA